MFGYVRADTPYLYIKDQTLYRAVYCGLCKGISEVCGQCARMGLSYDVTFLSVLLHNLSETDVTIEKSRCAAHMLGVKKPMAKVDELTRRLGALNTILAYYKYTDDIEDEGKGIGKRLWFKKGRARAARRYPEIEEIVRKNMAAQSVTEKSNTDSVDRAADATANMLAELSDYLLFDKKTVFTHNLFYALGKWIYLIDALDDYDKDIKKGLYNPFVRAFREADKKTLVEKREKEISFIFHSLFYDIRESLSHIAFRFNRDLSDNILLRGLPKETERVMRSCGAGKQCKKGEKE